MSDRLVACGRISSSAKELKFDRTVFSVESAATHLSDREMQRLADHYLADGNDVCKLCEAELVAIHLHISDCRVCKSKLQVLLHSCGDGPEDRFPDMLTEEVESLHVSTPPDRDFSGLGQLSLRDEDDRPWIAD